MVEIKRLVLDVLKPHDPDVVEFATEIAECPGVDGVNAMLLETDREVQNVKFTVEGDAVEETVVTDTIDALGGTVHSVDEVICGERMVEESHTVQDGGRRPS